MLAGTRARKLPLFPRKRKSQEGASGKLAFQCNLMELTATRPNVQMGNRRYVFAIIAVGALSTTALVVAVEISIVYQVKATPPQID